MKLLVICGPTATGKTALALTLAYKCNGNLISADSRQVYKGMDIGTGKDIPKNFQFSIFNFKNRKIPYYSDGKIRIFGLDLVTPDQEFSVSHYQDFAIPLIEELWKEGKLPIVVGGTGLYIKALLENIETVSIPANSLLRKTLENKTVLELQKELVSLNKQRFAKMNHSDANNSRRLIRAIEVETWKKTKPKTDQRRYADYYEKIDPLIIGLITSPEILAQTIGNRVEARIKQGMRDEIQTLLKKGYDLKLPSLSALGYRQWRGFIKGTTGLEETCLLWKKEEIAYAKRQLTWFKRQKGTHWFNATGKNYRNLILDKVQKWYTSFRV